MAKLSEDFPDARVICRKCGGEYPIPMEATNGDQPFRCDRCSGIDRALMIQSKPKPAPARSKKDVARKPDENDQDTASPLGSDDSGD